MGYLTLREPWRGGGSFTRDPENMLSKALERDICFHSGPALGENGHIPRAFERRDTFFI